LQGYVSDRPERSASQKKWNALIASISNIQDPISFQHSGRHDIFEQLTEIDPTNYAKVFGLVTLAGKSDQIARQRETTERANTYGKDVSFLYEHQDTLYEKHLVAKAADRNVPEDEIIFNSDVVQIRDGFGSAVVGAVKASELARLHTKHGNRRFE
ncbi:O-GlcNAcase, partial [Xanthomonas axonopodis pv. cajani]